MRKCGVKFDGGMSCVKACSLSRGHKGPHESWIYQWGRKKRKPALWLQVPGATPIRSPEKQPRERKPRKLTNPRSKLRRQQYKEYIPAMIAFLKRKIFCERRNCQRPAVCVHHFAGRRGKQLLVQKDWRGSCDECNVWAKNNPKAAREEQWLAPVGEYHV